MWVIFKEIALYASDDNKPETIIHKIPFYYYSLVANVNGSSSVLFAKKICQFVISTNEWVGLPTKWVNKYVEN